MEKMMSKLVITCTYDENGESAGKLLEQVFRTFIEIELRKTVKN